MAQFPDCPGDVSITPAEIDAFCNDPDYTGFGNATSVYGYFRIQSNGLLRYNNVVTAYFTASQDRGYYTDTSIRFGTRAKELIHEGLSALKAKGFDFSQCDADNNGVLDGVSLLYAGNSVNRWGEGLWHHKSSSSWAGLSGEGVSPSFQYQISPIGTDLSIGTFCFESAHLICGFPDLYAYDDNAADIGNYSLMGVSGTKHPRNIDAYLKIHAGWATVQDLDASTHVRGVVSVDNNTFYRFRNPSAHQEYFLLSMRTDAGYEGPYGGASSRVNPANGLVIWHARENGSNTYSSIVSAASPAADYSKPYELMVVEANPGSGTTPWYDDPNPGTNDAYHSGDVSHASDATTPALNFWDTATGRTTSSQMDVNTVSAQGEAISFVVGSGDVTGAAGIGLTPTALTASCDYGTDAPPQRFAVFNSGGGTLDYTISESLPWLSLDVGSGTATTEPDFITLTYDTDSLAAGNYAGTLTVTDAGASNSPQTIHVALIVNAPVILATSTPSLDKSLSAGTSVTDSFSIANDGGGTLRYTLSQSSHWFTPGRASGTATAETDEIQVTYDASNLVDGAYRDDITVSSANAGIPSQTITVTMNVTGGGDLIVQSPEGAETLWQGNRHDITWVTNGAVTGDVKIELYKGGVPDSTIVASTVNDGFYQWLIPDNQAIGTDYRIRITSVDNPSINGETLSDFAIAALPQFIDIPCSEGFEADLGDWMQSEGDDFNWLRHSGGTLSNSTGPTNAPNGSFYIFTEASHPNSPGKSARLESAFDLRNAAAPMLSFYYHMYGETMGTLAVRASIDQSHWTTLFSQAGNQGNAWQEARVDLSQFAGQVVLIQIVGITGNNYFSDMALDAIGIDESLKTLTCDTRIFTENSADDGSISHAIAVTLAGDTFTSSVVSGDHVTAGNVPAGLTAAFVRDSSTQITVTLSGNAISCGNKDTVSDLRIQFTDGAFSSGDASAIAGHTQSLMIDYIEIDGYRLLSVTKAGIGLGTVTSEPAGIDCGKDCSQAFFKGATITLTATAADAFSRFAGWSGGGCTGTGNCVVNLTGDTVVTAIFDADDRDGDGIPDHLDAFPDDADYHNDGDNDGMPSVWETRYGLNPAIDEAGLDADGDGLSNLNEFIKGTDPRVVTSGPGVAELEAPDDFATQQALTPTLETSYAATASADAHAKTCWQIAGDQEFTLEVFRVISPKFRTWATVPLGILDAETTYYWRAQYIDTEDIAWSWAAYRSFDTQVAADPDHNGNGLPDSQEVPAGHSLDLDQDTVDDLTQADMHCLRLQAGSAQTCLKNGDHVLAVRSFTHRDANAIEEELGRPADLPVGLFSFGLRTDDPGAVVSVRMCFSEPLPVDMVWYTYDSINGWSDDSAHATLSDDGRFVDLKLMDGGYGDADGVANGIVVHTSGPGSIITSSGGCFIDTASGFNRRM
ncbi:M6 family metalloprotease domain-containing protein [Desulfoluna sp.]|uniref:M6 family metalloprotease domain-containing protein n=1 Tax=Desulfoluna sp. TaxID=2045199 RepID=UPI0026180D01|nr:M6 family metalloprotease domain-containing protein [Desulfoluna sp.]